MQRRENFWPAFLVVLFLCVVILILSLFGKLKFLSSFLEKGTSAVQSFSTNTFQKLSFTSGNKEIKKLKDENLSLLSKIVDYERLKKENSALLDQFKTAYPTSYNLLEAAVIGMSSFIPGVSTPSDFIINKGSKDNLKVGMAVVIKNNLVGIISKVSENIARVNLINNSSSSFTAKTQNGVTGVFKGGVSLTINNVLLSESIKTGELVLTKGSINSDGIGIPPDLVVGEIISVDKKPSELFQKAEMKSFVDFVSLSTVFVYTQIK